MGFRMEQGRPKITKRVLHKKNFTLLSPCTSLLFREGRMLQILWETLALDTHK